MNNKKIVFDTIDCIDLIKKTYPYIPRWIIKRVCHGQDLYMYKIGIIADKPLLEWWERLKK